MTSETIELASADGFRLKAYKASPVGRTKGAIVLAPEIFGINSHIRSMADGFAAEGYLVIAPQYFDRAQRDFESGYSPEEIEVGKSLMSKLDWDTTMKDTAAAIEHVRPGGKIAVIGYCWGGTVAWLASARLRGIAAAVSYYGGGIPNFIGEAPRTPIMLHIGEHDKSPSPEHAREVSARYPDAKVFIYPAGHGFNCDQRASYDAASAQLARQRTLEFLAQQL